MGSEGIADLVDRAPRKLERAAAGWLAALGLLGIAWSTVTGPALLATGLLAWTAAAWLVTRGRLPARTRLWLAQLDPDRVGAALVAAGLAAFALVVVTQAPWPYQPLLVAGAWALTRRELPSWAGPTVLTTGCLVGIGPLLDQGVTIGARGALAHVPLGEQTALASGFWLPLGLGLALLGARSEGWIRGAALVGALFVLVQMGLGPTSLPRGVLSAVVLGLAGLPGVLALLRDGSA